MRAGLSEREALAGEGVIGREEVVREVTGLLAQGRSVLLVGPPDCGKTALVEAVTRPGVLVVDPMERVSRPRAAALRRALDRGMVCLAAARTLERAELGCVGRVLWRLTVVRVRPLGPAAMRAIIEGELRRGGVPPEAIVSRWIRKAVRVAAGRPGWGVGLAERAAARWRESRTIPPPGLALVEVLQEDALVGLRQEEGSQAARRSCRHRRGPEP